MCFVIYFIVYSSYFNFIYEFMFLLYFFIVFFVSFTFIMYLQCHCFAYVGVNSTFSACVLLCFIDPRVNKIRNQASSCPGIFSRTLRFYCVASSPSSPLPHLLDGHRKLVGRSAIPARSCPGPVRYHWGSIVKLKVTVPPDGTPGLTTLHPHSTIVLQSITYAKSPYPPNKSNSGPKTNAFDTSMASPSRQYNFTVRVPHRYIITASECGRCHRPSLGAPAVEYHGL